ncbi:MAG: 2-hydroxyacyl-CoA dehydratase [Candidatus Bathyarchaeota archaeon]|nr:MAG: 2-hydroxyacyl-CoA dehydratase [Candidatus Bathyarchaeota archaeon]
MQIQRKMREFSRDPTSLLRRHNDGEAKVVGYMCSGIPEEIIIAAGLQPYRISNIGEHTSSLTPSFICPFASAVLENILRLEDLFQGFIVAHTCDPMWRIFDILKKKVNKPLFFLRVPHNTKNELSFDFMRMEFRRLKMFLERNFVTEINNNSLQSAIELCNHTRDLLRNIYLLNRNNEYKVKASDYFSLVLASAWMSKQEFNALVEASEFGSGKGQGNIRLHVNGTAIYDLNLITVIEDSGGFVVSDDLCTGSRYFWDNVEPSQDPLSALTSRYLTRTPCPAQNPLDDRLRYLSDMVASFNARGVITYAEKFCDPILYDFVHIRNKLASDGIPSLLVDYESPTQEINRIRNRVEAFIETLGD